MVAVDLSGAPVRGGPVPPELALGVVRWNTPVHRTPSPEAKVLGYLRAGAVIARRDESHGRTKGCKEGWQAIEPRGWVCKGDVTEERKHPVLEAITRGPSYTDKLPYMYGTVTRGGPVYGRIPTQEHLAEHEPNLAEHIEKWKKDEVSGATYGLDVWLRHVADPSTVPTALEAWERKATDEAIPPFLRAGGLAPNVSELIDDAAVKVDQVDRRQGRSFIESFLFEGRRYNLTPDLVVIPADRFRPIRGSDFRGWQVGGEVKPPFALVRRPGARLWAWDPEKKRMSEKGEVPWRSLHLLTGKQQVYRKKLFYERTEDGLYLDGRHASRIDLAKKWPKWAKEGGKWIDINITKQALVAYEGKTMVYATLVSTGEAGLDDPEDSTATIRGIYRVDRKFVATTMDSDAVGEEFELRDVPYVQYFKDGYALHGAYWHDKFGRPKSHGCINLAPEDARRLFFWTDPQLPPGWHGVREALTGTHIFVHP